MSRSLRASRIYPGLPPHGAGLRIGLYGGSFNPAHAGHRQVSLFALRRLDLDWIWWLVTPGNPLKELAGLPTQAERMWQAASVAAHPRIAVTGLEAALTTRYTAEVVEFIKRRAPGTRFVWVMGSDNLVQFSRWHRWREIAGMLPIAVVNRPGFLNAALHARAAQALRPYRVDSAAANRLADLDAPAWTFLVGPRTTASSTALRVGRQAS